MPDPRGIEVPGLQSVVLAAAASPAKEIVDTNLLKNSFKDEDSVGHHSSGHIPPAAASCSGVDPFTSLALASAP